MGYNAKPWLRRVGAAATSGMSRRELEERGFEVALGAMRAAYYARHPEEAARHEALLSGNSTPRPLESDGNPAVECVKSEDDSTAK